MDDNENDETFRPPISDKGHVHNGRAAHTNPTQMNMRGVFLHVLADALGSVIVIVSAMVRLLNFMVCINFV